MHSLLESLHEKHGQHPAQQWRRMEGPQIATELLWPARRRRARQGTERRSFIWLHLKASKSMVVSQPNTCQTLYAQRCLIDDELA
ncbi:hypothetical protein SPHV1_470040 [Novosphingobium sp. KN65.2]|nr:hypothetical protein SPHV1_470040 [Novosphingobium sp. KN65.2]